MAVETRHLTLGTYVLSRYQGFEGALKARESIDPPLWEDILKPIFDCLRDIRIKAISRTDLSTEALFNFLNYRLDEHFTPIGRDIVEGEYRRRYPPLPRLAYAQAMQVFDSFTESRRPIYKRNQRIADQIDQIVTNT